MPWPTRLGRDLRRLLRRSRVEREMREEMEFHLQMEIDDLIRSGHSPADARRIAHREFGGVERMKEEARQTRRLAFLERWSRDLRVGWRSLRRAPGFTAVAVLTVGLGIGANTAIVSVVQGVLLRPLPYPESDRIVSLWQQWDEGGVTSLSYPNFLDWKAQARGFESMGAYDIGTETLLGRGDPVTLSVGAASAGLFETLAAGAVQGRLFSADERIRDGPPVLVVSHGIWERVLDPELPLAGQTLDLGGKRYDVVGVLGSEFEFPTSVDAWYPLEQRYWGERSGNSLSGIGRLSENTTVEQANRELDRIAGDLAARYGTDAGAPGAFAQPLLDEIVGSARRPLLVLLGASVLLLLVGCMNVAGMLLARGPERAREVAIRTSLGAERDRIVSHLLLENVLVGALGSVIGVGAGWFATVALRASAPSNLPRVNEIGLDGAVLGIAFLMTFATVLLFGLFPALRISRVNCSAELRAKGGGGARGNRQRFWTGLIGAEVAVAFVLIAGSSLLVRSLAVILDTDLGFRPEQVVTMDIDPPAARYLPEEYAASPFGGPSDEIIRFYQTFLDRAERVPGVEQIGIVNNVPLGAGNVGAGYVLDGERIPEDTRGANYRVVGGGYFDALGVEVLAGRSFDDTDHETAPQTVLVNRAFAEENWPDSDPIGQRIRLGGADTYAGTPLTVVGVVEDVRHRGPTQPVRAETYVHFRQRSDRARRMTVAIRTAQPETVVPALRDILRTMDSDVPVTVSSMEARVANATAERRFTLTLLGLFAGLALLLAAVGIYGIVSYFVAQQRREIGIRLALGAPPGTLRRSVALRSMRTVLFGLLFGAIGSILGVGVIRSLLYEIAPFDLPAWSASLLLVGTVAWAAGDLPARRAAKVDPVITMRAD